MNLRFFLCLPLFASLLAGVLLLQGCRSSNPVYDTLTNVLPWKAQYANLQPGLEYLWVSVDDKASVMALGSRDVRVTVVHEHWYTGQGEMLYLVDGRVQQALGFTHELRQQTGAPPAWGSFEAALGQVHQIKEFTWTRQLDVMPGYRFGVQETLVSRPLAEPERLPEGVPARAHWVAEDVQGKQANGLPWVYVQRFALANNRVVYSEQCLAPALCLAMRPLGVGVPK